MNLAAALFAVATFAVIAALLRLPRRVRAVVDRARAAVAELRSPELDERQKERAARAHALHLTRAFAVISTSTAVALLVPLGVVALLEALGVMSLAAVLETTTSWVFLAAAGATAACGAWLWRARRK